MAPTHKVDTTHHPLHNGGGGTQIQLRQSVESKMKDSGISNMSKLKLILWID